MMKLFATANTEAVHPEIRDTNTVTNPSASDIFEIGMAKRFTMSDTTEIFLNMMAVNGKVPSCAASVPMKSRIAALIYLFSLLSLLRLEYHENFCMIFSNRGVKITMDNIAAKDSIKPESNSWRGSIRIIINAAK